MLIARHYIFRFLAALLSICAASLAFAADPAKGSELYALHCATCHGVSGVSLMPGAPNFSKNEGLMKPDGELLISIQSGKAAMPAYRGILSAQDTLDVISYLRTLN